MGQLLEVDLYKSKPHRLVIGTFSCTLREQFS